MKRPASRIADEFRLMARRKSFGFALRHVVKAVRRRIWKPENNIAAHAYRTVCFYIPKVASRTLLGYFADVLDIPDFGRRGPSVHPYEYFPHIDRNRARTTYADYFKFAFVRNPWDRVVSAYNGKLVQNRSSEFLRHEGLYHGMPFDEFIRRLAGIHDDIADPHLQSQYLFLSDRRGQRVTDFIGRVEHFDRDFRTVCERSGLPYRSLRKENAAARRPYREYYDDRTRNIVRERYATDLEWFGYEF